MTELPALDPREHKALEELAGRKLSNTEAQILRKLQTLIEAAEHYLEQPPELRKRLVQECEHQ